MKHHLSQTDIVVKKKDFAILLLLTIVTGILAGGAFYSADLASRDTDLNRAQDSQGKFDRFVGKVRSGEWQLTTEQWIKAMQLQRTVEDSQHEAISSTANLLRIIGFAGAAIAAIQAYLLLSIRHNLGKQAVVAAA